MKRKRSLESHAFWMRHGPFKYSAAVLEERFAPLLALAQRVRQQDQRQRGPKVYSLHAPEVECIGRGKAASSPKLHLAT